MKIEKMDAYIRGNAKEQKIAAGFAEIVTDRIQFEAKMTPENAEKIAAFIDALDEKFTVYQWREKRDSAVYAAGKWGLFHWSSYQAGDLRECGAQLSFNKKTPVADREQLCGVVLEMAREFFADDADDEIALYRVLVVEDREEVIEQTIKAHAQEIAEKSADFIARGSRVGRIKRLPEYCSTKYGFFPKGNRTHYFPMTDAEVLCVLGIAPDAA